MSPPFAWNKLCHQRSLKPEQDMRASLWYCSCFLFFQLVKFLCYLFSRNMIYGAACKNTVGFLNSTMHECWFSVVSTTFNLLISHYGRSGLSLKCTVRIWSHWNCQLKNDGHLRWRSIIILALHPVNQSEMPNAFLELCFYAINIVYAFDISLGGACNKNRGMYFKYIQLR